MPGDDSIMPGEDGEAPNEERGDEPDDRTLLAIRIFRMALRRMDITCAQWQRTLAP